MDRRKFITAATTLLVVPAIPAVTEKPLGLFHRLVVPDQSPDKAWTTYINFDEYDERFYKDAHNSAHALCERFPHVSFNSRIVENENYALRFRFMIPPLGVEESEMQVWIFDAPAMRVEDMKFTVMRLSPNKHTVFPQFS